MVRLGRALLTGVAVLGAGCGQITFGEPIDGPDRDAGGVRDAGPPPRDAGTRDTGPMGDAGCMPHELPGMPESWPWESSREALDALFIKEFNDNACFQCHAASASGAETVFSRMAPPGPLMAPYDTEYEQSKTNMWALLTSAEPATFDTAAPVGRLWFHMPNFQLENGEDNDPQYDPMDTNGEALLVTRMNRLLLRAQACNNTKYAQMPADAGSNCGPGGPRDGGPISESDGGDLDGGVIDGGGGGGGGGGSGGLCYCELGDLGYAPDLLLYCSE